MCPVTKQSDPSSKCGEKVRPHSSFLQNISTREIIVIVIAIMIIVGPIIYLNISDMFTKTETKEPRGFHLIRIASESGIYIGSFKRFTESVELNNISMTITDSSLGASGVGLVRQHYQKCQHQHP